MTNPRYDRHQRAHAERRVNTNYGHHPRDNYRHQAPPGQHFYNDNRNNQDRPQRQQRWTKQGGNDGMQRHQQPVGFVSPAGRQHLGHQHASDTFNQRPTGHHEAYPFVGVSPSAQHHSSLPIMLTCNTAAPGGADTGAHEGEGEDSAEDDLHDPWHVPYSDSYADFETMHRSRAFASVISFIRFYLTTQPTPVRYIVENVPCALDFPEILSSLGTGNIMRATACGSAAHRDTLLWTNIASQTDVQDYIDNINAIELTDPGPCAWDLCLSEFPHFTPVTTADGGNPLQLYALAPWASPWMICPHLTFLRRHCANFSAGSSTSTSCMRNYIKAVSGAAPSPAVITVCHTSYGTFITSDGEAWVLIDSGASSHVNAHRTDYIYYMDIPAAEQFLVGGFGQPAVGTGTTLAPTLDITGRPHTIVARDCYHTPDITSSVGLTNISRLLNTHQLSKHGYSFYFSRLLISMIAPDGAVIHLQPYPGTTYMYGIKLLPIRCVSWGHGTAISNGLLLPAGLAERSFRTIGECAQAMLLHAGLDRTFWVWAYLHAVYLCNRQWSSSVNAIPYTLMTGRKPDIANLHVFGCVAWVNIHVTMRAAKGKMTPKSWPGIYVGHHEDSTGYRIYNLATRRETVTRDVIFDEVTRPFSGTPALSMPVVQLPDDDHLMDEKQPLDQQEGLHAPPPMPPPMPPSAALASAQEGPPPPQPEGKYLPRHLEGDATALPTPHSSGSAHISSPYVDLSDYHPTLVASPIAEVVRPYPAQMAALALPAPTVRVSKAPRNYKEAILSNHPDDWKQSMDREVASITKMETFVWISIPELRRDNPSAIIIQTAWAFAEKQDKDGNLIKRKARVVFRGDQFTAGENYDGTKTYAPVAPKAWFLRFSSFLRDFGFVSSECDPGVWTLLAVDGSLLAILCVYVDDSMLATSPSSDIRERFQTSLFSTFDATTDGLRTWLLGMAIDRKPGGVIHLHQEKNINDILTTFNMAACAPRRLPCTPDTDFHDPTGTPLDTKLFPYPNLVGSLIWLAVASRPDIAFVVGRLCAYMASPTERHWQIAVSVLRYLEGTPNHGLIFRKQLDNEAPDFLFFVDADWATFMPKRCSTTGYLALVHGTPVAYRAQVQKSVVLSTAEAEFVALCMACKCLAFIRVLLRQLHHPTTNPVRVCEENQACIVQMKHGMITGAQRHIDLKFQYAAQLCQDGVIDMHYTPTAD
eukprot:jgi/Tetstr1/424871/TSEL_015366.t1